MAQNTDLWKGEMMHITDEIKYIGVNDHEIDLFEGQYIVENGMAYNSYVILDEKNAVLDTVDGHFTDEWLQNLSNALGTRRPDFLIVQHMEPDHSASIAAFLEKYPDTVIAASAPAFAMLKQFYGIEPTDKKLVIKDRDTLSLGAHELTFVSAPLVHWPEVMMTYDSHDHVLFSADAFGKFGALDTDEDWACEARRYYFGIVGKFGIQVQTLLKKVSALDVQIICPLHGPVLDHDLSYYLKLYNTWSSYGVESAGVMIAYTSVYGNTKKAVMLLADKLREKGCPKVVTADLAREDMAECVEDAFRYGTLVLATTTYNTGIFPFMHTFINHLTEKNYQNRTIGMIENGAWAPMAIKNMKAMLEGCKNITFTQNNVTIKAALDAGSTAQLEALAEELCRD